MNRRPCKLERAYKGVLVKVLPDIDGGRHWLHVAPSLALAVLYCAQGLTTYGQTNYQRLKSFGDSNRSGERPQSPLLEGRDGAFYGTTTYGGTNAFGTIFKLLPNGDSYSVIHLFTPQGGDRPITGLVQGTDDSLYGTTSTGGSHGGGTVFRLNSDGSGYTVLYGFSMSGGSNATPSGLILDAGGWLYGTAAGGGTSGYGTVFKLNTNGSSFITLHNFAGSSSDGASPNAALALGLDGVLYGTASSGGSSNVGVVFRVSTDGSKYTILHSFTGAGGDGADPGELLQGRDGMLYGTTASGGTNGSGIIFKMSTDGAYFSVLMSPTNGFPRLPGYARPRLIQGNDGALYGTTAYPAGTAFKLNTDGSGYVILHSFSGPSWPEGGLLGGLTQRNADGVLYGTTAFGGASGSGTAFKLDTNGLNYAVIADFSATGGDGRYPVAGMLSASDGGLYGTTFGTPGGWGYPDQSVVFRLSTNGGDYTIIKRFVTRADSGGSFTTLVEGKGGDLYGRGAFGGAENSGTVYELDMNGNGYNILYSIAFPPRGSLERPEGALIQGADGSLYGTLEPGLDNGTVFKLSSNGSVYTSLYEFSGPVFSADGSDPVGLLQATDGILYGTTYSGGSSNLGTIFRLNTNGYDFAILYNFKGINGDGCHPQTGLIEGIDGALYGTTYGEIYTVAFGTIFKINKDGSGYTVLHSFTGGDDGSHPAGMLVQAPGSALLYGTTEFGGSNELGTVFRISTNGSEYTILRHFGASNGDGSNPRAGLVQGGDGAFYGTTRNGGDLDLGTVFKLFASPARIAFERIERRQSGMQLILSGGAAGQAYQIEARPSLSATDSWQGIGSAVAAIDGTFSFLDTDALNHSTRFYRCGVP